MLLVKNSKVSSLNIFSWKRKWRFFLICLRNVSLLNSHGFFVCLFVLVVFSFVVWLFFFFFAGRLLLTLENKILHKQLFECQIFDHFYLQLPRAIFIQTSTREKGPLLRLWNLKGKFCPGPPAQYLPMAEFLGDILT